MKCPICKKEVKAGDPDFPFCGERCRIIDLGNWSAEKYVGTIFRDAQEAALVDAAVLRVLRILHDVGADAPAPGYLEHPTWPEAIHAAREAHVVLAANDGDDPDAPPRSLDVLAIYTRAR